MYKKKEATKKKTKDSSKNENIAQKLLKFITFGVNWGARLVLMNFLVFW